VTKPIANFNEEHSAKIPALALLVLRSVLATKTFPFMGKQHPLSEDAIDKIVRELASPAMNEGLMAANEKLYNALTFGVGVTEFIDGKKVSPTIQIIDWQQANANQFHFTEEMEVENAQGTGKRVPDIVCFVNGLPWVVIEAKRPDSSFSGKPTIIEGISQNIRNQKNDETPHLFAYSQLLLSINGHAGNYATCGTPATFWAKWKEEEIEESEFLRLKNQSLTPTQLTALFDHRPAATRKEFEALIGSGQRVVTDQDRLLASLLRPDRLLDMTRLFTLFDNKAGRIAARYQQVFGIKALISRVTSFDNQGARNGGVIWHTTGSGKSFTMVYSSPEPLSQAVH